MISAVLDSLFSVSLVEHLVLTVLGEFGGAEQSLHPDGLPAGPAELVVTAGRLRRQARVPRQRQVGRRVLPGENRLPLPHRTKGKLERGAL